MKKKDNTPSFLVFMGLAVGMAVIVLFWKYILIVLCFVLLSLATICIINKRFRNWLSSKIKRKQKVDEPFPAKGFLYKVKENKLDISELSDDELVDELIKRGKIEKK